MWYKRVILVGIAAMVVYGSFARPALGQTYKKGDIVVALADTPLKIGTTDVGIVRAGQILTIRQSKGKWLWIESKAGPERLVDFWPKRQVITAATVKNDVITSYYLANPLDGQEFTGFTRHNNADEDEAAMPLPVRSNAQWGPLSGTPCRGWLNTSAVAPAIELRVQGKDIYYSVAEVERLTRSRGPKDGFWSFDVVGLAVILLDGGPEQGDVIAGTLCVAPVTVKQPNRLRCGHRYGVFLVATIPGVGTLVPASEMVIVERQ